METIKMYFNLIETIKQYIADKYNIDKKDIEECYIRYYDHIKEKYGKDNSVLKLTFVSEGKPKTLYAKFNGIYIKYQNSATVDLMLKMGFLGYAIPKFHYIDSLYSVYKSKYAENSKNNKKENQYDESVLITEDGLDVEDVNNFKNKAETYNITKDKAIDRLIMEIKFGIGDNKTENTKAFKKYNDKNKEIFFDPTYFDNPRIFYLMNYIKDYNNISKNEITLKSINENKVNCYEAHIFRLLTDFLIEQAGEDNEIKNELEDSENLTIRKLSQIYKQLDISEKFDDFYDFLLRKKYPNIQNNKEREQKHFNKMAYYYNKNKEKLNVLKENYKTYKDKLEELEVYIDKFQSTYHPLFIGNNVDEEHRQNGKRQFFNFKNNNTALDFKIINKDDNSINILEAEQLNKEKRETAEDYYFSFDKEKFCSANINDFNKIFKIENDRVNFNRDVLSLREQYKEGEEKNNRLVIQNTILHSIILLANSLNLTIGETSHIILASIDNNGYSNIKNNNDKKGKILSAKFQQIMSIFGIGTGRKNSSVGLRLKRLPKSIVGELYENKDKFTTKQPLEDLSENLNNVNLDIGSKKLIDYYNH